MKLVRVKFVGLRVSLGVWEAPTVRERLKPEMNQRSGALSLYCNCLQNLRLSGILTRCKCVLAKSQMYGRDELPYLFMYIVVIVQ